MNYPSREELSALVKGSAPPCLSIYTQSVADTRGNHENGVRVKGLLRQAEILLEESGLGAKEIKKFLDPVRRWEDSQPSGKGVAFLLSGGKLCHYRVPLPFDQSVTVGRCFYLRPLLSGLLREDRFYVLTISQKHVRLFLGNRERLQRVDAANLPKGLADALKEEDEDTLNVRSAGPVRLGKRALISYGNSAGGGESKKEDLLKYFRIIDKNLHGLLREQRAPLVLAGVDYYFPLYRDVNSYSHLLKRGIPGSPDRLREKDLHAAAWKVVEPYFTSSLTEALDDYDDLRGQGLSRSALDEVLRGAHDGQIAVLFIASQSHEWGEYDHGTRKTVVHKQRLPKDDDLLDLAVSQTLSNGGKVFVTERDTLPDGGVVAAGLRY